MGGASLKNSVLTGVFMAMTDLAGADLRDATLVQVEMTGANLSSANLERIKYDQFTLQSLSRAKLDGARISEDLRSDLKSLSGAA